MKRIITAGLLIICIGTIRGVDLESYQFIDRLLSLGVPGAPVIYENAVIFTAPSSYRSVGISFAHEGYSTVYWLKNLTIPRASSEIAEDRNIDPTIDSGVLFHVQNIPDELLNMDYRLIIEGLWTADPLNPVRVTGSGGILQSRVSIPPSSRPPPSFNSTGLSITFNGPPGQIINIAGSFNGWDPFMYQLREIRPGHYTFNLTLPPGTYEYVFFYRGDRITDPNNPHMIYTRDGRAASQAIIQ